MPSNSETMLADTARGPYDHPFMRRVYGKDVRFEANPQFPTDIHVLVDGVEIGIVFEAANGIWLADTTLGWTLCEQGKAWASRDEAERYITARVRERPA